MTNVILHESLHNENGDKRLFSTAVESALAYIQEVTHRSVIPSDDAISNLQALDVSMPEEPISGEEVLHELNVYGSAATIAQTGGRYFGFVNGGVLPAALAARWLADAWDQNAALHVMSPIASRLEQVCERWLIELLGLPRGCVAGFVSGTSVATLCGLAAARHAILADQGWNVENKGLCGAPRLRVVTGEQAHGTVYKALAILGLGAECVERVPVDDQGRLKPSLLPTLDKSTIVILQAGNVNTGAFDPFDEICALANDAGAWVHIDGAFGLWAAASEGRQNLTAGIHRADSWAVDAHKTLNAPYDCGIALTRWPDALAAAMRASGAYIQYGEGRDGMTFSPDMSRRARAIELWATLRRLGRRGVADLVDELCERAQQFAHALEERGFRVLNEVVFNQVLVACESEAVTRDTLLNIQSSGECWCGGTQWRGASAIRISVCSWVTTSTDVSRSVAAFEVARSKARSTVL